MGTVLPQGESRGTPRKTTVLGIVGIKLDNTFLTCDQGQIVKTHVAGIGL